MSTNAAQKLDLVRETVEDGVEKAREVLDDTLEEAREKVSDANEALGKAKQRPRPWCSPSHSSLY